MTKLPQIQAKIREDQPPASKGEGWKAEIMEKWGGLASCEDGDQDITDEVFEIIQTAIDEAVEDGKKIAVKEMRQKVLKCGGLGGMKHLDELLASVLNPQSPQ